MKKLVIAKLHENKTQKRLTIPKQKETEEWNEGDLILLKKLQDIKIEEVD